MRKVLTNNLSEFSKKLNNEGYFLNDVATDTTIMASLKNTVAQLNQVSQSANAVVQNLNATTSKLNNNQGPVGVLLNDTAAAATIQTTLMNLESATKKLDENMEAMRHNFLFRGYFKKQAKEEEKRKKDSLENAGAGN
jgi:phospholipid/cholesterol/gamma-HCH transport system substrate-binding protein